MKNLNLIAILLLLCACAKSDDYKNYLGYWQEEDSRNKAIAEISKDGDTYLINRNIFREKDLIGKMIKPSVLIAKDGKLTLNQEIEMTPLSLSEDQQKLYFDSRTYTRVDNAKAPMIQKAFNDCKNLRSSYRAEVAQVKDHLKINTIRGTYEPKFQAVMNCSMPSSFEM